MELVNLLETKAKEDEEVLSKTLLTRDEAKKLYNEIASLIRAIMDLRDCEAGRIKLKTSRDEIKNRVDDARRWVGFLKNVGKKNSL